MDASYGKKYRINEDRVHFTLSIPPETMQLARNYYQIDDCGNISEYIGKAIEFYSGYVANKKHRTIFRRLSSPL